METYFATPQRSDKPELLSQIKAAANNAVIDGVMCLAGGLIAILNKNRQILTVNHSLLEAMGVDNPNEVIGLRPGEALGCIYSDEMPAGCGTGSHCVTCGAAIAIISTLGTQGPVDTTCTLTVDRQGNSIDLYFNVHASTFKIEQERFVLVFLQDITQHQQQAALERIFFHDIKNTIMGLLNASELLLSRDAGQDVEIKKYIQRLTNRLSKEVELQQRLRNGVEQDVHVRPESLQIDAFLQEMQTVISSHPSKMAHRLKLVNRAPGLVIYSDIILLMRVLANMLINAFEADDSDNEVRLEVETRSREVIFSVWNAGHIASSVCRRIFQRNFTTKNEAGRGLGTFSMKLIGEQLLGGRVYFETGLKKGTLFFLALPLAAKKP